MSQTLLTALGAAGLAALLAVLAAMILMREAAHRDMLERAQRVARGPLDARPEPAEAPGRSLLRGVGRLGDALRGTFLFRERDVVLIERAVQAAGLDGRRTAALILGAKALLLVVCPLLAYAYASAAGLSLRATVLAVLAATAFGSFAPNWGLAWVQGNYVAGLRKGLPDAMDLLVVCAEAGLGLESALERVAQDLRPSAPGVAMEIGLLVQELRMTSDRRAALRNFGDRAGVDGFRRIAATLSQTLRYGTPLGQALRVLAAEMRQERLLRIEEKAARLPALLSLALAAFILPCLFIVLAGPAAMRILDALSRG